MVFTPRALLAVLVTGLAIQGCASNPPLGNDALVRAEASINQANTTDPRHTEVATLQLARQKLDDAKQAQTKGDHVKAERLARQADLEAQLATARAQASDAEKATAELRTSVDTLRKESVRSENQNAAPAPVTP